MILSQYSWVLIGLLLAAWTLAAGWAILSARAREQSAETSLRYARRLSKMVDESPAIPLLVRTDGRVEAPQKLASWFGLDAAPQFLSELGGDGSGGGNRGGTGTSGLPEDQLAALSAAVRRTQKTAMAFQMNLRPHGSKRSFSVKGHLADAQISPAGAALIWITDTSESEEELTELRKQAVKAR
ncbi:MAG: hypothetical protein RLY97_1203, partial [Pseudomonadota bacterium]